MSSYVYIMTDANHEMLYIGITSNIAKRVSEHKKGLTKNHIMNKYKCHKLVFFEKHSDIKGATSREKSLKTWERDWKNKLINLRNPQWLDLSQPKT